jgi:hypothetical protein
VFGGSVKDYDLRVARRIGNALRLLGCEPAKHETINGVNGRYHDITEILEIDEKNDKLFDGKDYKVSNEIVTDGKVINRDNQTFAPDGWE